MAGSWWSTAEIGFLLVFWWIVHGFMMAYTPQTQWQVPINPLLGLGCLIKGTTLVAGEKYVRVTTELYHQAGVYRYPGWQSGSGWHCWVPCDFLGMIRVCNGDDRWRLLRISHLSISGVDYPDSHEGTLHWFSQQGTSWLWILTRMTQIWVWIEIGDQQTAPKSSKLVAR